MSENQNIIDKLHKQFEESSFQAKATDLKDQFMNLNRDIGFMRVHLMANATANVTEILSDPEELEILDTVVLMLEHIVSGALKHQEEVGHFRDLYEYLALHGERGWRVYALFSSMFVQAFYCQIFASASNAQGMLPMVQEDVDLYRQQLQFLADISDDQKKHLFKTLRDMGVWPANLSTRKFQKQLDDYLAVIKEDQHRRYEAMNAKNISKDTKATEG